MTSLNISETPQQGEVRAKFNVRGGIYTEVEFEDRKENWNSEINL